MSPAPSSPISRLIVLLPNLVLLVGLILASTALASYSRARSTQPKLISQSALIADASLLTERQLAVSQAIKNGQKTYTFTSNFTPGIGRVVNPPQYEQQWSNNLKPQFPNLKNDSIFGNYLPPN